jgi:hypothetical protein
MRLLMGIVKDRHGTYCARKKVPQHLEAAVARVLKRTQIPAVLAEAVAPHEGLGHRQRARQAGAYRV